MAQTDWSITIQTPGGNHTWAIGDYPEPDALDDLIVRAKVASDFPHGTTWFTQQPTGWFCVWHQDSPHEQLQAQVHDAAELAAIPASKVQAWRDADAQEQRQERLAAARATLAGLDDEHRALLLAELGGTP